LRGVSKDGRKLLMARDACKGALLTKRHYLIPELLAQDALLQAVAGVEQHPHRNGLVRDHFDAADVALSQQQSPSRYLRKTTIAAVASEKGPFPSVTMRLET
jgi:hypothetical protein